MQIRDADAADWPAIRPVFDAVMTAGETYTWPPDAPQDRSRAMWMLDPPGATFVAVDDDGTLLGSAKANPNQLGPGAHVASASFLVAPTARRRGVGRALGEHALAWAAAQGFRAMQFNAVVATNTPAVTLWHSLGFETIGRLPEGFAHPTHGYVDLLIMHRRL